MDAKGRQDFFEQGRVSELEVTIYSAHPVCPCEIPVRNPLGFKLHNAKELV